MVDLYQWQVLLLIFIRMTSFILVLPLFTFQGIPALLKIFFGLVVSYLLFISLDFSTAEIPLEMFAFTWSIIREIFFGISIGFAVLLIFSTFQTGASLMDVQIGFRMSGIFDPQAGNPVTILGRYLHFFALVLYFIINGHHYLFMALASSFEIVPLGGAVFSDMQAELVVELFTWMFVNAFQIAAPILVVLVMNDVALGLVSKTVPQIQVFMLGLPMKIGLGLLIFYIIFPYMIPLFENAFDHMHNEIYKLMGSML